VNTHNKAIFFMISPDDETINNCTTLHYPHIQDRD